MPVITEEMLRTLEKNNQLATLKVTKKDIFTPSAREFLNKKGISILDAEKTEKIETVEKREESDQTKSQKNQNVNIEIM